MSIATWRATPAGDEPLAVEIKRHTEHWIHWDRSTGPVFLSDLPDFSNELLQSFKSDTAAILTSLNNERQLLLAELRSLPPGSPMAAREIKLKLRRVIRKEESVRVLRGEATNVLHLRNTIMTPSKKKRKKKKAKRDEEKIKALALRHSDHQALQRMESRAEARHRFALLQALIGERNMAEVCAVARSLAAEEIEASAPELDLDPSVTGAYVAHARLELTRELEGLGCDLEALKAKYAPCDAPCTTDGENRCPPLTG